MPNLHNIYQLGIKEWWSIIREPVLLVLIVYVFTASIYIAATSVPDSIHKAAIAIVDEDNSPLSQQISSAFYPPHFISPQLITLNETDKGMDQDRFTFVLDIPPHFQRDVLAGKNPQVQLNVDATRMSQAFVGSGYIQQIAMGEVNTFVERYRSPTKLPVEMALRMRFNPNLTRSWFIAVVELINQITMLSIILTGAALIREREHGTLGHLLVMPVTPLEIMLGKVWSMGLVVLAAASCSLYFIVRGVLQVPIEGSMPLFLAGAAVHLFATASLSIFLATMARSMPQFRMLLILVMIPMQMLSGGSTPRESMPEIIQYIMLAAPTTHFIELGQSILYRGAGIDVVWSSFLWLFAIGGVFFAASLFYFRRSVSTMG
jgi:ABC-2 type transport system permease protein